MDVQEFVTTVPRQRRIVEPPRNQLDTDSLQSLLLKLLRQVVLDGAPFAQDVDPFLILLEHPLDQDDSDPLLQLRKFIERVADDIGEPPDTE